MLHRIDLDNRDILQINAVIIAGAFIFLTIFGTATNLKDVNTLPFMIVISLIVLLMFSLSSLFTIIGFKEAGMDFMMLGFVMIFAFAFIISSMKEIRGIHKSLSEFLGIDIDKNSTSQSAINQTVNQHTNQSANVSLT